MSKVLKLNNEMDHLQEKLTDIREMLMDVDIKVNDEELQFPAEEIKEPPKDVSEQQLTVLKFLQNMLPTVSVKTAEQSEEEVSNVLQANATETGLNLKNFDAYEHYTADQLENRLNNVSVTSMTQDILAQSVPVQNFENMTAEEFLNTFGTNYEGVEFGSTEWFYLQYLKNVKTATFEVCFIAKLAADGAKVAYDYSTSLPTTLSLEDRMNKACVKAMTYMAQIFQQ